MATAAEIRNKAAKKLGLLGTGQTLQSAISNDLDDAYEEAYAELEVLQMATWAFDEEVPDYLVHPVVSKVAYARVDEYSLPDARRQKVVTDGVLAEGRIRQLQHTPKMGSVEIENF